MIAFCSQSFSEDDLMNRPYLLGDWNGARTSLEEKGVTFDLNNTFDVYDDISGALDSGTEYFGRARATMNLDLEKLIGMENATFSVGAISQYGRNYNRSVFGVLTNPSSIEGVETTRMANIWLEQTLFENLLTYRVGKVDGVGNFGSQEYGGTFMNDELAYIPNLLFAAGLPYDPAQQLGAVVTVRPFENSDMEGTYLKGGIFNSNNLDAMNYDDDGVDFTWDGPTAFAGEIGYISAEAPVDLPWYAKGGVQFNSGSFTEVNGSGETSKHNTLYYANVGKSLYLLDEEGDRHIDGSISLSYAPKEEVNVYHYEVTALLRAIGPFASRPTDEAGIGLIAAWLSDEYSDNTDATGNDPSGNEFTVELTYKLKLTPWIYIQPDFQVVLNPNGNGSRDPVYLGALRTGINF